MALCHQSNYLVHYITWSFECQIKSWLAQSKTIVLLRLIYDQLSLLGSIINIKSDSLKILYKFGFNYQHFGPLVFYYVVSWRLYIYTQTQFPLAPIHEPQTSPWPIHFSFK